MRHDAEKVLAKSLEARLDRINRVAADIVVDGDSGPSQSVIRTKEDIQRNLTPDQELHRLFVGTDKYDEAIKQLKEAIASGSKIINVISPGYKGYPGKEITDLVISSAVQQSTTLSDNVDDETKEQDFKRRNSQRENSIVSEMSFTPTIDAAAAFEESMGKVDGALLGTAKFKHNSDRNILYEWTRSKAASMVPPPPVEEEAGIDLNNPDVDPPVAESPEVAINKQMQLLRDSDIIFSPDNDMSYLYPCLSLRNNDISAIESRAQEARNRLKSGEEAVSDGNSAYYQDVFAKINGALGILSPEAAFMPYGISPGDDFNSIATSFTQEPDVNSEIDMMSEEDFPGSTYEEVAEWMRSHRVPVSTGEFNADPGELPGWLAANFPSSMVEWFKGKDEDEQAEIMYGWRQYAIFNEATQQQARDIIGANEETRESYSHVLPMAIEYLKNIDVTAGLSGKLLKYASIQTSPAFTALVRKIMDAKGLDKNRENEARAIAAEIISGRLRAAAASELTTLPETQDESMEGLSRLTPGASSPVSISIMSLAALLNAPLDESVRDFTVRVNNTVSQLVIRHGESSIVLPHTEFRTSANPNHRLNTLIGADRAVFSVNYPSEMPQLNANEWTVSLVTTSGGGGTNIDELEYSELKSEIPTLHTSYGIKVNRGPLPNWAPDPYDFRTGVGFTVGNANSCHNVYRALVKRKRLEQIYKKRASLNKDDENLYACAMKYLVNEIEEMEAFLEWARENHPDEVAWAGDRSETGDVETAGRYTANSAIRYVDQKSESFYDEVKDKCATAGVNIPIFNQFVDQELLQLILPRNDYQNFLEVYNQVSQEWGKSDANAMPSIVIMKGIDNVSSEKNMYNGITDVSKDRDGKEELSLNPRFVESISAFVSKMSHSSKVTGNLLLVSEREIPASQFTGMDISYVFVAAHIASADEVQQYIEMFAENVRRDYLASNVSEDLKAVAEKFFVPQTFIEKFRDGLSGLAMPSARAYLQSKAQKIFNDFMTTNGDILSVMANNELSIEQDIEDRQSNNDVIKRLTIKSELPSVGPKEYVTQHGSTWATYVNNDFGDIIDGVESSRERYALLLRLKDAGVIPVNVDVRTYKNNSYLFIPSYASRKGRDIFWMRLGGKEIAPSGIDPLTASMMANAYNVSPIDLFDHAENARKAGNNIRKELNPDSVSACEAAMNAAIEKEKKFIFAAKQGFPNIMFLYGDPGSGKTIFGEVLAKAFGLRYNISSLDDLFNAGRGTQFRGQSENNIMEFNAYCKATKNTVFVIDEMHKFFSDSTQTSDKLSTVSGSLQTAWNDNAGTFNENNFFILCTSNLPPAFFEAHSGSALMNRLQTRYKVEVPTHVKTLKEFFTSDALMNNMINQTYGDDIIKDRVKRLVKAYERNDEAQIKLLVDELVKSPTHVFDMGLLSPEKSKREMLAGRGIEMPNMDFDETVKDFVDGWLMIKKMMNAMDDSKPINFVNPATGEDASSFLSPLEKICLELEKEMLWLEEGESARDTPEARRTRFSKGSMRNIDGLMKQVFMTHSKFLSGHPSAIPLNYQNLWFATRLTSWVSTPDEAQSDPFVAQQKRRSGAEVNGWNTLQTVIDNSLTASLGITKDMFLVEDDHRYVRMAMREGLNTDRRTKRDIEEGRPVIGADNLADKVTEDLFLQDMTYDSKIEEAVALLRASGKIEAIAVADWLGEYKEDRSNAGAAREAYKRARPEEKEAAYNTLELAALQLSVGVNRGVSAGIGEEINTLSRGVLATATTAYQGENRWVRRLFSHAKSLLRSTMLIKEYEYVLGSDEDFDRNLNSFMSNLETDRSERMFNTATEFSGFADIHEGMTEEMIMWAAEKARPKLIGGSEKTRKMTAEECLAELNPSLKPVEEPSEVEEEDEFGDVDLDEGGFGPDIPPSTPPPSTPPPSTPPEDPAATPPPPPAVTPPNSDEMFPQTGGSESVVVKEDEEDRKKTKLKKNPKFPGPGDIKSSTDYLFEALLSQGVFDKPSEPIKKAQEANIEPQTPQTPAGLNIDTDVLALRSIRGMIGAARIGNHEPETLRSGPYLDIFAPPSE